jgi:hypothetical protein
MMKFLKRGVRFGMSFAAWVAAGRPRRDPEYVTWLFVTHCEPCGNYDPELKICSICECFVSEKSDELNKLVWATEGCPMSKPKFQSDVGPEDGGDGTGGPGDGPLVDASPPEA